MHIVREGSLWIAEVPTSYGAMEFLCGEGEQPSVEGIVLIERFLSGPTDHMGSMRRSVFRLPILWRPIRFAINNEGRIGVQFKNRITGRQVGMFFADERSAFKTRLSEIKPDENDRRRLTGAEP